MASGLAIQSGEEPRAALRRLVSEQALSTAALLRQTDLSIAERVHRSRKRVKETRALLRLFRKVLGRDRLALENRWYRDAARELADFRDADAVRAAVGRLSPQVRRRLGRTAMQRLRRLAAGEYQVVYQDCQAIETRIELLAAQLPLAARRVVDSPLAEVAGFEAIAPGLMRTLRRGRRAMREAVRSKNPIAFHEWRKLVKEHRDQLWLLRHFWRAKFSRRHLRLQELARILGEHHDLELIRSMVAAAEERFDSAGAARIDKVLLARQRRLAARASPLGRQIYGTRPRGLAEKIARRWPSRPQPDQRPSRAVSLIG